MLTAQAGGRIEVRAPLPQSPACTAVLFADAAVATDWAANAPAADAAYVRRADIAWTWSRRRRGRDVDIPWRRVAAAPRLRRGYSVETGGRLRYGVAFQANVLRVDVTKRLGAFQQRAKLSLTIENPFKGLRCP